MKIGILKTDDVRPQCVDEFGEYPDMFARLLNAVDPELTFNTYEVQSGHYPKDLDEVDAYLITGSKSSVYDDKPWIRQLEQFVQQLHAREKKLIGICFGHQLVAHCLGGETQKSDKGWGVGVHSAQITADGADYAHNGQSFKILVTHQDQIVTTAPGTKILAASDFCPAAMCQLGEHILAFQGHPEFVPEYSRFLLNVRREHFSEETYQKAMNSLEEKTDHLQVAQWIIDFIRR